MKFNVGTIKASIHLNKKRGLYYLRYSHEGKQKSKGLGTSSLREAKDLSYEFLEKLGRTGKSKVLLSDIMKSFEQHRKIKDSTMKKAQYHFGVIFTEYFENCPAEQISSYDLIKYKTHLQNMPRKTRKGTWSKTYINNNLRAVKQVWNFARSIGLVEKTHDIFISVKISASEPRKFYLNPRQLESLHKAASDDLIAQAAIEFLYNSGFRISELFNLKWVNIKEDRVILKDTKTAEHAIMPMLPGMRRSLDTLRSLQNGTPTYVWSGVSGKRLTYDSLQKKVKKYLIKAGFPEYRPHDLRHSFITNLVDIEKLPVQVVKELARHKTLAMTMNYYSGKVSSEILENIDFMKSEGERELNKSRSIKDRIKKALIHKYETQGMFALTTDEILMIMDEVDIPEGWRIILENSKKYRTF